MFFALKKDSDSSSQMIYCSFVHIDQFVTHKGSTSGKPAREPLKSSVNILKVINVLNCNL